MSDAPDMTSFISNEMMETSYAPFKLETMRLVGIKDQFEGLLKLANYNSPVYRNSLISTARVLFSEAYVIFTSFEVQHFEESLNDMINADNNLETIQKGLVVQYYNSKGSQQEITRIFKEYIDQLEHAAYRFLVEINGAMQKHGVGIKTNQKEEQVETLRKIFKVKNQFDNKFGIPISIEMELFCRNATQRVMNKYDNFFIVEAGTGDGKTNFSWAAGSTIAGMLGNGFNVNDNFIFNEDKTYVDKLIRNAPFGFVINFDEIGNQANSKTHWDPEQILLMNDTRLIRFMGLTMFGCWTSKDELDKQLRTRVNGIITIENRGTAQFRTYNKNRFTPNKEFIPYHVKNKVAYTSADANNIIEMYDELKHLTIPFYEVPKKLWDEYEEQKMLAKTMRRQAGKFFNKTQTVDEYYAKFVSELPADCSRVTTAMLDAFSKSNAYQLSFRRLVEKVGRATGKQGKKMFVWSQNPMDMWDGYFEVDAVISSYIMKLKAMHKGAENTQKV